MKNNWIIITIVILVWSCVKDPEIDDSGNSIDLTEQLLSVPEGFPEIPFPEENEFSEVRWKLGKKLFFDPILSRTNEISCGSCHKQDLAFSDNTMISPGVDGRIGERNSPSLANVAYFPYYMREGGVPTLELQVLVPIQEHAEMDFNILEIAERLNEDSTYVAMSKEAYDRVPDAYVITRALSTFERTLISGESAYDLSERGELELDEAAERGKDLFFSERSSCSTCHDGFLFTNHGFFNNGLYEEYEDPGKYRLTADSADLALFKVPSLRNVGLSAPYMHDGSLATLEDVVGHYNAGGQDHPQKDDRIKTLNLTDKEIDDLIAFLNALTDERFTQNELFDAE